MSEKFIITIARQYGSGGLIIGKKLAQILNVSFYDKELLEIASKKSGLEKDFFESVDEISPAGFSGNFQGLIAGAFAADYSVTDSMFEIQSDIIKVIARKESAIFVGRCADYVLRSNQNCINIFICADKSDKAKRIISNKNIDENSALAEIEKVDKQRAKYYNYYTGKVWGAADSYHLCVNTSAIPLDDAAECISKFAKIKFKINL
jgi:cytidylate kinase